MAGVGGSSADTLSLNLNPMLDIFSILITFLLMSFGTDPVNHSLNQAVELPASKTLTNLDEIPAVVVTKSEILINDAKVVTLIGGKVEEKDLTQGAIYPVFKALQKIAERNKEAQDLAAGSLPLDPTKKRRRDILTMEMDKGHSFELVRRVMLSAQQAEFITFKLMVSKQIL